MMDAVGGGFSVRPAASGDIGMFYGHFGSGNRKNVLEPLSLAQELTGYRRTVFEPAGTVRLGKSFQFVLGRGRIGAYERPGRLGMGFGRIGNVSCVEEERVVRKVREFQEHGGVPHDGNGKRGTLDFGTSGFEADFHRFGRTVFRNRRGHDLGSDTVGRERRPDGFGKSGALAPEGDFLFRNFGIPDGYESRTELRNGEHEFGIGAGDDFRLGQRCRKFLRLKGENGEKCENENCGNDDGALHAEGLEWT